MPAPPTRFVEVFCAVVETGNYTLAAHQLGVTPAAVSRAVSRREHDLGVKLFHRTTRSMQLTDVGQRYFEQCRRALDLLADAERELTEEQAEPRGLVRLSVPTTYGHHRVLPALPVFIERHPHISLDIDITNRNVDVVAERYDLVIRMGSLADSSLVVRKLEDAPIGVFASPAYLARRGPPVHPSDLAAHQCVVFVRPSTGRALPWLFNDRQGGPFEVPVDSNLRCINDTLGCITLARAGAGLVQSFRFLVEDDLRTGRLVEILTDYNGRRGPFSLLQPVRSGQSLAVRRLAAFLIERFAG